MLNEDGTITIHAVTYRLGEKFACACPNYNRLKRDYPVSRTYCLCCAGHFRYHYEIMLGVKLRLLSVRLLAAGYRRRGTLCDDVCGGLALPE